MDSRMRSPRPGTQIYLRPGLSDALRAVSMEHLISILCDLFSVAILDNEAIAKQAEYDEKDERIGSFTTVSILLRSTDWPNPADWRRMTNAIDAAEENGWVEIEDESQRAGITQHSEWRIFLTEKGATEIFLSQEQRQHG